MRNMRLVGEKKGSDHLINIRSKALDSLRERQQSPEWGLNYVLLDNIIVHNFKDNRERHSNALNMVAWELRLKYTR